MNKPAASPEIVDHILKSCCTFFDDKGFHQKTISLDSQEKIEVYSAKLAMFTSDLDFLATIYGFILNDDKTIFLSLSNGKSVVISNLDGDYVFSYPGNKSSVNIVEQATLLAVFNSYFNLGYTWHVQTKIDDSSLKSIQDFLENSNDDSES